MSHTGSAVGWIIGRSEATSSLFALRKGVLRIAIKICDCFRAFLRRKNLSAHGSSGLEIVIHWLYFELPAKFLHQAVNGLQFLAYGS